MAINLGRSKLAPFEKDSYGSVNHNNRKRSANQNEGSLKEFCRKNLITLRVHNMGTHYAMTWWANSISHRLDWWPQTAKLVEGGRFNDSITCHGIDNLFRYFAKKGVNK